MVQCGTLYETQYALKHLASATDTVDREIVVVKIISSVCGATKIKHVNMYMCYTAELSSDEIGKFNYCYRENLPIYRTSHPVHVVVDD